MSVHIEQHPMHIQIHVHYRYLVPTYDRMNNRILALGVIAPVSLRYAATCAKRTILLTPLSGRITQVSLYYKVVQHIKITFFPTVLPTLPCVELHLRNFRTSSHLLHFLE